MSRRTLALVASALLAMSPHASHGGQPPAQPSEADQLSQEIARLTARVKQLEAENARLSERLRDLQARSGTRAQDPAASAPIPPDPLASPVSMLSELIKRYDRDLASIPRSTAVAMDRFRDQAQKWCKAMNAELRGKTKWTVLLSDVREISATRTDGLVQVLDPDTLNPIGEPVRFEIPGRFAERIKIAERVKGSSQTAWDLTAGIQAEPRFNPDRADVGVFNVPAFVGPYVEFGIRLEWQSLSEVELPQQPPDQSPAGQPAARPDPGTPR